MVQTPVTPVAVMGMACRLPGEIDSPELEWEALLRGDDLITEIPAERWHVDEHYDTERGVTGRSVSRWGAFLDEIAGFDLARDLSAGCRLDRPHRRRARRGAAVSVRPAAASEAYGQHDSMRTHNSSTER